MGAWVFLKLLTISPAILASALCICAASAAAQDADPAPKKKPVSLYQDSSFSSRKDSLKDGSSSMTYGTRLQTEFDTKVGVDVGMPSSQTAPDTDTLVNRSFGNGNSGSAWATLTMPTGPLGIDASSNAKLDSTQDQSKLGLGLSRKLPINNDLQMKLRSDYGMTSALPTAPSPGAQSAGSTVGQTLETKRAVEFDLLRTETTIRGPASRSRRARRGGCARSVRNRKSTDRSVSPAAFPKRRPARWIKPSKPASRRRGKRGTIVRVKFPRRQSCKLPSPPRRAVFAFVRALSRPYLSTPEIDAMLERCRLLRICAMRPCALLHWEKTGVKR